MSTTTLGMFDLIDAPWNMIKEQLNVFQQQVEDEISAITGGGIVTSVFGRTGIVEAQANDYTWAQINKSVSSLADLSTRSASDLNSGTLPSGRMPALSGDISTASGSTITTIGAGKVTSLMLQSVTGTGSVVLNNTPTLITPILGAAIGTSVNLDSLGFLRFNSDTGIQRFSSGHLKIYDSSDSNTRGGLFARRLEVGNDSVYDPGTNPVGNYFHIIRSSMRVTGNPNLFDKWQNITSYTNITGLTQNRSGTQDFYGINSEIGVSDPTNTYNLWTIYGGHFVAFVRGFGNIDDGLIGSHGRSLTYGSGTTAKQRGIQGWPASMTGSTGTSTLVQAVYGLISNDGAGDPGYTMTTAVAGDFLINSNWGTIGTGIVIRARGETSGTGKITGDRIGIQIDDQNIGTVQGTVRNFWSKGTSRLNVVEGLLGVGSSTSPTEKLTVSGNVFINTTTANLYLKDTSTGWQSVATTVITPQANNSVQSTNYMSGLVGWNASALGNFEVNNIDVRGAIHAGIFVYNALQVTAGTQVITPSGGKLRSDVIVTASPTYGTTTFVIEISDQDGLSHAGSQLFAVNDILRLKDGLIGDTWFKVTGVSDQTTFWRYTASIQAGTANVTYRAGLGVPDYRTSGYGYIVMTADQSNSPHIQMATHDGTFTSANSAGTLNVTPQLRIGNLNGSYGYGVDVYGMGAGQYGTASKSWITVEQTNGIRMGSNTTTRIQLNPDGSGFLANSSIAWNTSGNLTVTANTTIAGWSITSTSMTSGGAKFASNENIPSGAHAYFGKEPSGRYGFDLRDASNRTFQMWVNESTIYPYFAMYDGSRYRVVIGGLNAAFGSDGSTNSMGMKIWNSSGGKIAEFSDVQNIISGWTISTTSFSSTGITITSGASAGLAFGTTPPTSASNGTGIWLDRTGLYGLLTNVVQAKFDSSTGAIIGGGGNSVLDSNGFRVNSDTSYSDSRAFRNFAPTGTLSSFYDLWESSGADHNTHVDSHSVTGKNTRFNLRALSPSGFISSISLSTYVNALPIISLQVDSTNGINIGAKFLVPVSGSLQIFDGSTMKAISFGPSDSAGTGFRYMRIPN